MPIEFRAAALRQDPETAELEARRRFGCAIHRHWLWPTFSGEFRSFLAEMPSSVPTLSDAQNPSGHGYAAQRGDRSVAGVKNATKAAAMTWYVSYRTGGTTRMHILRSRELAIDVACRFFDRGCHDALEVGPMLGPREGNVLDERDIRRIRETGTSSPVAMARPDRRRSLWGGL